MGSEFQPTVTTASIECLPNEIISIILQKMGCRDILNFASTCKRFYDVMSMDQILWKQKFKNFLPVDIVRVMENHPDSDWFVELKRYFNIKRKVKSELALMSSRHYWKQYKVTLEDVRNFFDLALTNHLSYYFTIIILQEVVNRGHNTPDPTDYRTIYSLTEMYYARVAIRHLMHTFLAVKWVRLHIFNELTPMVVINFFLQWIDTDNLYCDKKLEFQLNKFIQKVEDRLFTTQPWKTNETVRERIAKGIITDRDVLAAISHVLYGQPNMAVNPNASIEMLNPFKVLESKCSCPITVASIYVHLAKAFGVDCELAVFPNHLFVEWKDKSDFRSPKLFTLQLDTGEMLPKRQCPYSPRYPPRTHNYNPDSLLQYIYAEFSRATGIMRNWHTENSVHLLDFLGTDDNELNPYRNFLPYLLTQVHEQVDVKLIDLTPGQLHLLRELASLNPIMQCELRPKRVNKRVSALKYAIGMLCRNKKMGYVCIVTRWDIVCHPDWTNRPEVAELEFGANQPFYYVQAADQSERYVAQENLKAIAKPSRLYHLEFLIAYEFAYFDGFHYVPNEEKRSEYPSDEAVVERYRSRLSAVMQREHQYPI